MSARSGIDGDGSALKGNFRTETGEKYRGKGLPGIYADATNGAIHDLIIISCRGRCDIKKDGTIKNHALKEEFVGSLFSWTLKY